jgi:hypothetical protein
VVLYPRVMCSDPSILEQYRDVDFFIEFYSRSSLMNLAIDKEAYNCDLSLLTLVLEDDCISPRSITMNNIT